MNAIQVKRSIHIEMADVREDVWAWPVGYLSPRSNSMMEVVVYGIQRAWDCSIKGLRDPARKLPVLRRSDDNGRTWRDVGTWKYFSPIMGRLRLGYIGFNYIYNPRTGTLLRLIGTQEDIDGINGCDKAAPCMRTRLVWTQMSRDDGQTWSEPEQVIMQGAEFNAMDWAPTIQYGLNGGYVENVRPLWIDQERFVLPFNAGHDPATPRHRLRSACLIGRWRADDSGVDWTMSAYATVLRPYSWNGGGEPSVAILPDGRWFMTMRVEVGVDENFPSGKFYVVSADQGKTWSEPQAMCYEDGAQVFCPASLARVFVSSKNGRLYFIANILDKPTKRQSPRYPLQIAELDLNTFRVKRATVTVIEPQPDTAGTAKTVEFSNWGDYEDRETKNWVMFMIFQSVSPRNEQCTIPPYSFRYDIVLPD